LDSFLSRFFKRAAKSLRVGCLCPFFDRVKLSSPILRTEPAFDSPSVIEFFWCFQVLPSLCLIKLFDNRSIASSRPSFSFNLFTYLNSGLTLIHRSFLLLHILSSLRPSFVGGKTVFDFLYALAVLVMPLRLDPLSGLFFLNFPRWTLFGTFPPPFMSAGRRFLFREFHPPPS